MICEESKRKPGRPGHKFIYETLKPEECFRCQGFGAVVSTDILKGPDDDLYRAVMRMVPCPMCDGTGIDTDLYLYKKLL